MSNRLDMEREAVRKKYTEAKRIFSLPARELFNPMGFTPFQWLLASLGLCVVLMAAAVLLRN